MNRVRDSLLASSAITPTELVFDLDCIVMAGRSLEKTRRSLPMPRRCFTTRLTNEAQIGGANPRAPASHAEV